MMFEDSVKDGDPGYIKENDIQSDPVVTRTTVEDEVRCIKSMSERAERPVDRIFRKSPCN